MVRQSLASIVCWCSLRQERIRVTKFDRETPTTAKKARIYIRGGKGKYANPDFVIYDRKNDKVTRIVDAKNGNAQLSTNQKLLNEKGGVLEQSGRYNIKRN